MQPPRSDTGYSVKHPTSPLWSKVGWILLALVALTLLAGIVVTEVAHRTFGH